MGRGTGCKPVEGQIGPGIPKDFSMTPYVRIFDTTLRDGEQAPGFSMAEDGKLPSETDNLLKVIQIKLNCRRAQVVKLDVGAKGALVHFHNDSFPDLEGLIAYVQRLKGTAKLRPDSKLVITRNWPDSQSRINGALQLSKGLAKILS